MILICTPCHTNTVSVNYLTSMIALTAANIVSFDLLPRCGDSLITRCRNTMVASFLADERAYSHLMWIDSDIGFTPDALVRLLQADYGVCGGVYPFKSLNTPVHVPSMSAAELRLLQMRYPFNVKTKEFTIPESGFVEVRDIPAGFMLIKRSVLEAMMVHYPDLKYTPDRTPDLDPASIPFHYRLFDTMMEGDTYISEDFAFCHRAVAMGEPVYADLHSELSHSGHYLYQGNVLGTLLTCGALDQEQLTQAIGWAANTRRKQSS